MITVIISAYKRDKSLFRLLTSLKNAYCNGIPVDLVISLEGGCTDSVRKLAENFYWVYGKKRVIYHDEQLGLIQHFIYVGDLTSLYGDILFLEEDAIVSPYIFMYLNQMIPFYRDDPDVAGISLYNDPNNEMTQRIFTQVNDGSDVYFFQHPYMGNVWYENKWKLFKEWLKTYQPLNVNIPQKIASWTKSFKRIYIQFLVENDLYMVYPRFSLVSDCADSGLHVGHRIDTKAALSCGFSPMKMVKFCDSNSIYDAYFDLDIRCIKSKNKEISKYDFINDINGLKNIHDDDLVLTNRKVKKYIMSFDDSYKPIELAAVLNIKGDGLYLAYAQDIIESQSSYSNRCQYNDILRYYPVRRRTVLLLLKNLIKKTFRSKT